MTRLAATLTAATILTLQPATATARPIVTPNTDGGPIYHGMPRTVTDRAPDTITIAGEEVPFTLDWWAYDALGQCESSSTPNIETGNGFSGLYQIWPPTWRAHGGLEYAARPSQATVAEQTEVARRIVTASGWGQFPGCAKRLGFWR